MLSILLNWKYILLLVYLTAIAYIHFRGQVRLPILRQLTDHSSLLAPLNSLLYLSSATPTKTPFLNVADFPELAPLRANWEIIRAEALQLYEQGYIGASDKYDDIGFNSFFRRGWKRFYLKWYQEPLNSARELCPQTLALIERIPTINAAMFTLLPKQSFLFSHRDPYAGSLRYHLGLITPNNPACQIFVDGQAYYWQDGQDVMFDETYVHRAENKTDEDRIILFCDIQRPLKNRCARALNRWFSQTVMAAASSKNLPTEQVGAINRIFHYAYQIRVVSKAVKNYNRTLYVILKYGLYLSALYCWLR